MGNVSKRQQPDQRAENNAFKPFLEVNAIKIIQYEYCLQVKVLLMKARHLFFRKFWIDNIGLEKKSPSLS